MLSSKKKKVSFSLIIITEIILNVIKYSLLFQLNLGFEYYYSTKNQLYIVNNI